MNIAPKFWFLMRYGISGAIGAGIQTFTLYVWVDLLHLETSYLVGAAVGFCLALFVTFALQKYWTFRDRVRTELQRQFISYTCIALASLGLNILLLHVSKLLFEHFGINFFATWYLVAQIVIIIFLAALTFIANYFLTFRGNRAVAADV